MGSAHSRDVERRVRAQSRRAWNVWVGSNVTRERIAWGVAACTTILAIVLGVAVARDVGKPQLPSRIVTVDTYGQVLGINRPHGVESMTEVEQRHYLGQFVMDVFQTVNSATAMADQYARARFFLEPGTHAFTGVQSYWDRYSPLRIMPNGSLTLPSPVKREIRVMVTSYLFVGNTQDGAEIWELEWRAIAHTNDGDTPGQLYRGRITLRRSVPPNDAPDNALIANPFWMRVSDFTWDTVQDRAQ